MQTDKKTCRLTGRLIDAQRKTHSDWLTDRQNRQTDRNRMRQRQGHKNTNRLTERQTYTKIDKLTEKQAQ